MPVDLISGYIDFLKNEISENIATYEKAIMDVAYPTIEQMQNAAGARDALKTIQSGVEDLAREFLASPPPQTFDSFKEFFKRRIDLRKNEYFAITHRNLGRHQAFADILNSIENSVNAFIERVDSEKPSITQVVPDLNLSPADVENAAVEAVSELLGV
jgi:hypothetical protein